MSKDKKKERTKLEKVWKRTASRTALQGTDCGIWSGEPSGHDVVSSYGTNRAGMPIPQKQLSIERLFEPDTWMWTILFRTAFALMILITKSLCSRKKTGKREASPLEYLTGERRDKFIVWVNNTHLPHRKSKNC